MRKTVRFISLLLAFVLVICTPAYAGEDNHLKYIEESSSAKLFNTISTDLIDLYQFDITKDELMSRMITNFINENPELLDPLFRALFSSLDRYSEFYTPEEFAEFSRYIENVTGGIGAYMNSNGRYVEIVSFASGSAAEAAGVKPGDLVYKVDGEDMTSKGSEYVISKIRGEIGAEVRLVVLRGGKEIEFVIVRGEITQNTVDYMILTDNVAYVAIKSFTSSTDEEFISALAAIDKLGIKKIILDLRYNTGGFVDSAINIAKKIVPKGLIATHHMKIINNKVEYRSELATKKYEFVTLVNEYTASAAELLASALQESGASKLVGRQTFGKAVTQTMHPVYAGRMCKVTSGEYTTRKGNKINQIGIKPDYIETNFTTYLENTDIEDMKYAPVYKEGDSGEGIYAIKKRLNVLGYNVGAINENFDESLRYATIEYQKSKGIEATGVLDISTQTFIADDASMCEVVIDRQAAKAFELMGLEYTGLLNVQ